MIQTIIVGWRGWFTDDRVFDSRATDWVNLPCDGVLVLTVYYGQFVALGVRYHKIYDRDDYYWRDPKRGHFASGMASSDVSNQYVKRGEEIEIY